MSYAAWSVSSRMMISMNSGVLDLKTRRNVSLAAGPGAEVRARRLLFAETAALATEAQREGTEGAQNTSAVAMAIHGRFE